MAIRGGLSRGLSAAFAAALPSAFGLTACAPSVYSALSVPSDFSGPEVGQLASRAAKGDKHAQLELGMRYEEGRGVPVDLRKAMQLYASAASDGGRTLWLYSPPVGSQDRGQILPVSGGAPVAGLAIARERLRILQERVGK